jgi:hypothetical protein
MKDLGQFARNMNKFAHVVMIELEMFQLKQVFYILDIAGNEIIHADHMEPFFNKAVAEM